MRIISREHNFCNRFNFVKLDGKFAYMSTEKQIEPTKIKITDEIRKAFQIEDWDMLEKIFIASL